MSGLFYLVKCNCGSERSVFSHTTTVIKCEKCNEELAHPTGGEAVIHGEIVKELG
jgi:small subunit ribosomal protein S27e